MPYALPENLVQRLWKSGDRIVITGAGGWIGLAAIDLLSSIFTAEELAERLVCFGSSARVLTLRDGRRIEQRPLTELPALAPRPSIVLHTAFLTKDRAAESSAESYCAANREISETVLGALEAIGCTRLFIASSGAAARAEDPAAPRDLRLYGELKREDEERFAAWGAERDRRVVIARIFSLSGPYINKPEAYALAGFVLEALAGRPIEVRARRPVFRSYVAVQELVALTLAELLDGEGVSRFDSGGRAMEMLEIATGVADAVGPVAVMRADISEGVPDYYVGDAQRYASLLGKHGLVPVDFATQVKDTARYLADMSRDSRTAGDD